MSNYFVDSSVLLKRYITEVGSDWIGGIVQSAVDEIIIAQIRPVEVASGVARLKREGKVKERTAKLARLLVERHANREYQMIRLTDDISHRSILLLEGYPLRAYDAIQLASALAANERFVSAKKSPLIFVSADVRLLGVAAAVGLATLNPTTAG